jgi:membrane protease YdiL (CAAX protease family)
MPSKRRWLTFFIVGILIWQIAAIIASLIALALVKNPENLKGSPLAIYALIRAGFVIIGFTVALRILPVKFDVLGVTTDQWRGDVPIGLLVGLVWGLVQLFILIPATGGASRSDVIESRALMGSSLLDLMGLIVLGWVQGGLAEELFFRGHLIRSIQRLINNVQLATVIGVAVSVLYFGLSHRSQGWIGVMDTAVSGLIFALLFIWRGRLTAPIVAHGLYDMILLIGLYYLY